MNELKKLINGEITFDELINEFDESMKLVMSAPTIHSSVLHEIIDVKNEDVVINNIDKIMEFLQEIPVQDAKMTLKSLSRKRSHINKLQNEMMMKSGIYLKYQKLITNLESIRVI